jgi:hypothetical protein
MKGERQRESERARERERERERERVRERGPQWLKCYLYLVKTVLFVPKSIQNLMLLNKMQERGEEWGKE